MKTSDTFNLTRFALLIKQHLIHNHRMLLISIIGFCGGLFILFLIIQAMNELTALSEDTLRVTFIMIFIVTALLYTGTSFPSLRTREKSYNYLLTPASTLEKFLFELISRIIVFIILVPLLYWTVYHVEGYFLQVLYPRFEFVPQSIIEIPLLEVDVPEDLTLPYWALAMPFAFGLLIFTLPFTGAAIFMKYPLPKTLFAVAIVFFFHVFLVFFFLEILDFGKGHGNGRVLGMDAEGAIKFFTSYAVIANVVLITASYFKLKEREA